MRPGPSARSSRDARLPCSRSRLLRLASVPVADILVEPAAHHAGFRCAYSEVQIFRYSAAPDLLGATVELEQCSIFRHGSKRKAPGRLSPGPAVPLLTRGLIRDRHAKHAHRIGHFWAWRLQGVHICSLLSHRYSQARAAACISNPHSVSRRRAHAGDGTRSLLISIRQEQTERSQDRSPNRANQRR